MSRHPPTIVVEEVGAPDPRALDCLAVYLKGRLDAEARPTLKLCPKCGTPIGDPAVNIALAA